MVYVIITFLALAFLNLYCSNSCMRLFYQNKETALESKINLISSEISKLDVLNPLTVAQAVNSTDSLKVTRTIITDESGNLIYDSYQESPPLLPAVQQRINTALEGNDVFEWNYHDGVMISEVASPVMSYGITVAGVYLMEEDYQQGSLLRSIQTTVLSITLFLELAVTIFSLAFAHTFSQRLKRIMASMRIIQEGDFSHKVIMNGHDELTVLGDEFNNLAERLQTSENKRRQFVSDASHELKTPLASIKLLAETILQNDMDMETVREFVGDIGDEADRLNRMSQKLLDLTRGEGDESEESEIIYMAPTVERVVRMLSTQANQCQVTITTVINADAPILIREDDFYRIVFNLVENGIKYNIPGGTLTITLDRTEELGILKISDTGTGIPEDALGHIFERFYRVDKARSRASGGSGLGLSIVRNMVQRNQGNIHVESVYGKGTTFTLEFTAFDTEEQEKNDEIYLMER